MASKDKGKKPEKTPKATLLKLRPMTGRLVTKADLDQWRLENGLPTDDK